MEKPSTQFVQKLERDLRLAYRAEFNLVKQPVWGGIFKVAIPAVSGAFVVALLIFNFALKDTPVADVQKNVELITYNETADEEQLIRDFDNDELNQIDSNIQLAAAGNLN